MRACIHGARLLAVFASTALALPAQAELRRVWAVDDGTKIRPEDTSHPLARGNGIFSAKPLQVRLFGARNETVAFQVILQGGKKATHVSVVLDRIGPVTNGTKLTRDADRFYLDRRIVLFQQHYVEVRRRSADLAWEPGSAAEPKVAPGLLPDPLSPLWPQSTLTVPAGRNQGVWVDVYIPKDTPPGIHHGTLSITIDGKPCKQGCALPIALEVLPLTLPDVPTTKTMLYFSGSDRDRDMMPARYFAHPWEAPEQRVQALRERHFRLGRRHRVTMFIGQEQKPNEELARRLNGTIFTRKEGYEGPGEGIGQDVYSIYTYAMHDGKLEPRTSRMWSAWLEAHKAPGLTYFLYLHDEPSPGDYPRVNRVAQAAQPLPTFVTHRYDPAINAQIFAAPAGAYSLKRATTARAAGKRQWIYNGKRPFTGSFMIDDVAISPRVNPWIQYKYGIERWFYWESTYYKDAQGGRGNVDVWHEALNFSNGDGDHLNGDGLLIYPGRDLLFPKSSQGFDGPLPSIRIKNWRRGIEDVEYLELARARGHAKLVDKLLATLLPRALADATIAGAPVSWPEDGEKWLRARRLIADALIKRRGPRKKAAALEQLAAPPEAMLPRLAREVWAWLRSVRKRWLVAGAGSAGLLGLLVVRHCWRRRRSG